MDKLVSEFADLVRRNIAPSCTFFVALVLFQAAAAALNGSNAAAPISEWLGWVRSNMAGQIPQGIAIIAAIAIVIGVSYGLATINHALFDHFLRGNFDAWLGADTTLATLREKVAKRLKALEPASNTADTADTETQPQQTLQDSLATVTLSDYLLYEILGGIDPTDTRGFVHDAKSYGMFFTSCGMAAVLAALTSPWDAAWGWRLLVGLLALSAFGLLGRILVKAQYRARAIRLYVNFLVMPDDKLTALLRRIPQPHPAPDKKDEE